jgi:hypothetical protein
LLIAVVLEAYSRSPTAKLDCPVPPEVAARALVRDSVPREKLTE